MQDKVELKTIPVEVNRNLDILWVIDNSRSMEGEQAALIAKFPAFIDVLELPAVIFLTDEDDCSGADGLYADTAAANSALGTLSSYRGWKDGVICNGDTTANEKLPGVRTNCQIYNNSPHSMPLTDVVTALEQIKSKNQLILASIQGDTSNSSVSVIQTPSAWQPASPSDPGERSPITLAPSCVQPGAGDVYANANGEGLIARPAARLKAWLDTYPNRSTLQSICAGDLTPALTQIANTIIIAIGNPCIEGEL